MTQRSFVQWQAFVGPIWRPKQDTTAWNWGLHNFNLADSAGSLTATLSAGVNTAAITGITLPTKGGVWIGPNGTGQNWEYVEYTTATGSALSGCIRENELTYEHNGIHTSGAAVKLWAKIDTTTGEIHIVNETNDNLSCNSWTAEISGVAAPRAFLRRDHAIYLRVRYAPGDAWSDWLLGWIEEYTIDDNWKREAKWKVRITSIAGMLNRIWAKPIRSGDLDIAKFGRIIRQDIPLVAAYKEHATGDFTASNPDFSAKSAIDADSTTPWIAERIIGTPGYESYADGDMGYAWLTGQPNMGGCFINRAYLNAQAGLGKGYRWIQIQPTASFRMLDCYFANKTGRITPLLKLGGQVTTESRIFVVENMTLFMANNPFAVPTRVVEIGSTPFDTIDMANDVITFDGIGGWNRGLSWGSYSSELHMSSPPVAGQFYRCVDYISVGQSTTDRGFHQDGLDPAGYQRATIMLYPWFLLQLPGIGLSIKNDMTAGQTGALEIWDGKSLHTNGLPSSGTIQISAEQMSYTISSGILSVTARGTGGTTATTHKANDKVLYVDGGQATDAFAISSIRLYRRPSFAYLKVFKIWSSKFTTEPRHPVQDDEDPNHEYPSDYELLKHIDYPDNVTNDYTLTLATPKRMSWLLLEVLRMSTDPGRVKLDVLEAYMDTTQLDASLWLPASATVDDLFVRLLDNIGVPYDAITINTPLATTAPFQLATGREKGWPLLADLADYTSVYIEVTPLSSLVLKTNRMWRLDQSQTATQTWTRTNAATIQFIAERLQPIAQLQMNWTLPDSTIGGLIAYPATVGNIGEVQTLKDAMYPDATKANAALQRRYIIMKYPFTIGIQAALGEDSMKPGDYHTLTWDFADGQTTRTGFVKDVEHVVKNRTLSTAVRMIPIREAP